MMERNVTKINNLKVVYDQDTIVVKQSYRLAYDEVEKFCEDMKAKLPFSYKRSSHSWAKEIISHNLLYHLNLYKFQTEDTDLEENEKWYRLIVYNLLYVVATVFCVIEKIEKLGEER